LTGLKANEDADVTCDMMQVSPYLALRPSQVGHRDKLHYAVETAGLGPHTLVASPGPWAVAAWMLKVHVKELRPACKGSALDQGLQSNKLFYAKSRVQGFMSGLPRCDLPVGLHGL